MTSRKAFIGCHTTEENRAEAHKIAGVKGLSHFVHMAIQAVVRRRSPRGYYLAGPMTGISEDNYPAFEAAATSIRALGYEVLSPHEGPLPREAPWEDHLRQDVNTLTQCQGIILLAGWPNSQGARTELKLARDLNLEVYTWDGKELHKQ